MLEDLSDRDLINLVREGDNHAFDVLFRRYHEVLYVYSYKLLKDSDTAADIVQSVFIKLWEHSDYMPVDVNVKAYLYSMARNKVINYIRDNRSRLIHNYCIVRENGLIEDADFLQSIEDAAEQDKLKKAMKKLTVQQRKVIEYRLEGKSNRQIASELNLSLNTVNVHYRMGTKRLKSILKVIPLIIMLILC